MGYNLALVNKSFTIIRSMFNIYHYKVKRKNCKYKIITYTWSSEMMGTFQIPCTKVLKLWPCFKVHVIRSFESWACFKFLVIRGFEVMAMFQSPCNKGV
jgi:hypothetical protein